MPGHVRRVAIVTVVAAGVWEQSAEHAKTKHFDRKGTKEEEEI
jgi:hypothetical protein